MQYHSWHISGASSGIGEAFARAAPGHARLLLGGRNEVRLAHLAKELGPRASFLAGDLTNKDDRRAAIAAAEQAEIDLLIINAGIGKLGPFLQNEPAREMEMALLNMLAPLETIRALAPSMIERARRRNSRAGLILVSSVASFMPIPYFTTYAATKVFVRHLGEALSYEWRDLPIDCLVLCPGTTRTRFFARADAQKMEASSPMASPEQVAKEGLNYLGRKKVHVVGWGNRLMARMLGLLPHAFTMNGAARIMKSRL